MAGGDYASIAGTLTFNPGDTSKPVTVTTQTDMVNEDDETFTVNLSNPANATIADSQGVGTIVDDDAAPTISINGPIGIEDRASPSQGVQWLQSPPTTMAEGMNYPVAWNLIGGETVNHTCIAMGTDPEPTKKPMMEIQSGKPDVFKAWVPAPSQGHLHYQVVATVDGKTTVSEVLFAAVKPQTR